MALGTSHPGRAHGTNCRTRRETFSVSVTIYWASIGPPVLSIDAGATLPSSTRPIHPRRELARVGLREYAAEALEVPFALRRVLCYAVRRNEKRTHISGAAHSPLPLAMSWI